MKAKSILFLFLLMLGVSLQAQVRFQEPAAMNRVTAEYAAMYPADEEIQGWSILIALNRDRRKIDETQREFKYRYPSFREDVEWRFENPYYKLIVGAFEDRNSILPLLDKIRKHYPGAFEVKNNFPREEVIRFRRRISL